MGFLHVVGFGQHLVLALIITCGRDEEGSIMQTCSPWIHLGWGWRLEWSLSEAAWGDGMGRRQTPEVFSPWPRPPLIAHRFQTECQGNTIQESLVSNKQIKAKTIWCKTILYLDYICNVGEYSLLIGSSIKGKDIIKREAACMGTTPAEAEYYFLQSEY